MTKLMKHFFEKEVIIIMRSARLVKGTVTSEQIPISNVMFRGVIIEEDDLGIYIAEEVNGVVHQYLTKQDISSILDADLLEKEANEMEMDQTLN